MIRTTQQRDAIRQVIANAGRPLSTQEIFDLAKQDVPGLGIATVYRTLKTLTYEGSLTAVELPGQLSRWEETPGNHHHHFLCNSCDKLYEINSCPQNLQNLLPEGYTLEDHDILLRGQCATCASSS